MKNSSAVKESAAGKAKSATARKRPAVAARKRAGAFSITHLADAKFARRGLRTYFEYRDLGIERASKGKVVAHVIRALPGKAPHGQWHRHACKLQFVYVLKGWAKFEYEGIGEVTMKKGTCFQQPPNIRHREISHSRDLELIEIVAPADFKTFDT